MLAAWFLLRDAFEERRWRVVFGISMFLDLALWLGSFAVIAYLVVHHRA